MMRAAFAMVLLLLVSVSGGATAAVLDPAQSEFSMNSLPPFDAAGPRPTADERGHVAVLPSGRALWSKRASFAENSMLLSPTGQHIGNVSLPDWASGRCSGSPYKIGDHTVLALRDRFLVTCRGQWRCAGYYCSESPFQGSFVFENGNATDWFEIFSQRTGKGGTTVTPSQPFALSDPELFAVAATKQTGCTQCATGCHAVLAVFNSTTGQKIASEGVDGWYYGCRNNHRELALPKGIMLLTHWWLPPRQNEMRLRVFSNDLSSSQVITSKDRIGNFGSLRVAAVGTTDGPTTARVVLVHDNLRYASGWRSPGFCENSLHARTYYWNGTQLVPEGNLTAIEGWPVGNHTVPISLRSLKSVGEAVLVAKVYNAAVDPVTNETVCAFSQTVAFRLRVDATRVAVVLQTNLVADEGVREDSIVITDTPGVGFAHRSATNQSQFHLSGFPEGLGAARAVSGLKYLSNCLLPNIESVTGDWDFSTFNVVSFGDFVSSGGGLAEGQVAVGGAMVATGGLTIGENGKGHLHAGRFGLVVGGNAAWNSGQLRPSTAEAFVAGSWLTSPPALQGRQNSSCPAGFEDCLWREFDSLYDTIWSFQEELAALPNNTAVEVLQGPGRGQKGGLVFNCEAKLPLHVATVSASELDNAQWWTAAPECNFTALWLITVVGDNATMAARGLGTIPDRTVFNFIPDHAATNAEYFLNNTNNTVGGRTVGTLTLRRRVAGHVLASRHDVVQDSGLIVGMLVGGSVTGSPLSVHQPFCGRLRWHKRWFQTAKRIRPISKQGQDDGGIESAEPCSVPDNILPVETHGGLVAGDRIVIDPNASTEESATVQSLVLLRVGASSTLFPALQFVLPLQQSHASGVVIESEVVDDSGDASSRSAAASTGTASVLGLTCVEGSDPDSDGGSSGARVSAGAIVGLVLGVLFVGVVTLMIALSRARNRTGSSSGR